MAARRRQTAGSGGRESLGTPHADEALEERSSSGSAEMEDPWCRKLGWLWRRPWLPDWEGVAAHSITGSLRPIPPIWPRTRLASWGSPRVTNLGVRRRREVGDEPLGTASAADPRATDRGGLKNQNGNGRVLIRKLHVVCNV